MATASHASHLGWFRLAAIVACLWNAMGVVMYLSSVGVFGDPTAGLDEGQRAAASSIPPWITGAFAIGTFAGLIGSIGLLLRKAWAQPVLIVSLVGLLVLEGWILFVSGHRDSFGLAVPIMVSAGAILLAWLATHARKRGWLT
jgi:small basic protein